MTRPPRTTGARADLRTREPGGSARSSVLVAALTLVLGPMLAGCSAPDQGAPVDRLDQPATTEPAETGAGHRHGTGRAVPHRPLRDGERLARLTMPAAYTPSAPFGTGTDDYRCFLLDPRLDQDAFLTGLDILPGTRAEVHHVILFRVPPQSVAAVQAQDEEEPGEGWTCFGGTGVESGDQLDDAPWLGAWAPGGSEQVMARDVGVPMPKGSRVIMQVHYNLLAGSSPDVTSAQLRLAPGTKRLDPLETMLLPAPVELPCRPGRRQSPLCDRTAAVADAAERFGGVGQAADFLHLLCGPLRTGPVQSCDRAVRRPATIRAVAGHMHLLGRSIRVQVNPGTPRARTVLDIPAWNFDDQGATPVQAVPLRHGDTLRVTCRHDQALRDLLPELRGQQERYVVWGEGTTDEMCLGLLLVTRP